jgi:hypothetical protein
MGTIDISHRYKKPIYILPCPDITVYAMINI